MSDARSLLRARRADVETRINHPYAAYNASGQLRCTVCVIAIKNATAWSGHLGSKAHRTNVAQLKAKEAQAQQNVTGKRKAPESDADLAKKDDATNVITNKKQRRQANFPTDFFSDPNHPIIVSNEDEDEDTNPPPPTPLEKSAEKAAIDLEWEEFQRMVINAPAQIAMDQKLQDEVAQRETWNRATVFAEPELASETPEGFPERPMEQAEAVTAQDVESRASTEEELAQKKAREERELIMDRLLAEEQAQEDADNRVVALKARLEGIRKRKEATRLMKQKQ